MEDTLRVKLKLEQIYQNGLNPCFNGRYSQRYNILNVIKSFLSLNPCFNGRYSQRKKSSSRRSKNLLVLILVLMEDTLRVLKEKVFIKMQFLKVLILVLMEDTLRSITIIPHEKVSQS